MAQDLGPNGLPVPDKGWDYKAEQVAVFVGNSPDHDDAKSAIIAGFDAVGVDVGDIQVMGDAGLLDKFADDRVVENNAQRVDLPGGLPPAGFDELNSAAQNEWEGKVDFWEKDWSGTE